MTQVLQTSVEGQEPEIEDAPELLSGSCPQTVRRGSSGYLVKVLQRCLNERGSRLTVDGVFGTGTEREVREWQVRAGLECDGVVGPATWGSLGRC
jgi:peptidoglycan hydrolase-like protein with peptidoglycan-binding domain